jgi:hypothetical protein|nr:MAG TPA: prohead serine protease [Herelleviridae sp.]
MFKDDKFNFWCPIEPIKKATDEETGEPVMRIGGIASTVDQDADGETLDPSGFDIQPLKESGMVNWHHQAKNSPAAIIGEPSKVELRPEGLWIESDLYASSPMANEVYELAKTLEENSKTRRLGYSIEGKVIKRASNDKKSPLYNKIVKAVITGVAVTHMPKNPHTFVNIIKGQVDADGIEVDLEEEDDNAEEHGGKTEKKALTTESGAALMPESVDGQPKKTFSKSSVMECIFRDIPNITIPNAQELYTLIKNISVMNKRKSITSEDIEKAYDALGLAPEKKADNAEDVQKGDDADGQMGKEDETHDDEPRHNAANAKNAVAGKKEESEEETEDDDEGFEECDKNGAKMKKGADNDILKAIHGVGDEFKSYIRATAVLVNDLRQKRAEDAKRIGELENIIKGQTEIIEGFSTKLERYGSEVPRPKSLRSATVVDRAFAKGNADNGIEKGGNATRISLRENPKAVASLLDQASFAKGYDKEYGDALLAFEARPADGLPKNIIARLKAETGYEVVE